MTRALDQHFDYRLQVMNLRAARQQVLATNIANADTPGYQARDVDFASQLRRIQSGEGRGALSTTHARHLSGAVGETTMGYRVPVTPSLDGNTVEPGVEQMEFAENTLRYQTSLQMLNRRISGLMIAIKGE